MTKEIVQKPVRKTLKISISFLFLVTCYMPIGFSRKVVLEQEEGIEIILHKEADRDNIKNPKNNKYFLIFETFFSDSIRITYNKQVVFNDFVQTRKRYQVSEKYCSIDASAKKDVIHIFINKQPLTFVPVKGYQYYYFTYIGGKLGVTYSNVLRDYY